MMQSLVGNIEALFISTGIGQNNNFAVPQTPPQSHIFDINIFWAEYIKQKNKLESVINQNPFTRYIPTQIRISLENMLKKYSMLSIIGSDGYHLLKKWSTKRF